MSAQPSTTAPVSAIPPGSWEIEPNAGHLRFQARGMFGLATVKGTFGTYDGELVADHAGASGELRIHASALDTGNNKRDTHLRSPDFFDVETHPTVTFTLTDIAATVDGALQAAGTLKIRDNTLALTTPLTVEIQGDKLHLRTTISVDRAAAGLGWSKMGMIKGPAHLDAHVVLSQRDAAH
jgi:polyisoprenoid-binding protein YceI